MLKTFSLALISLFALAMSCHAQDSILITCSQHGDDDMTLKFSREEGAAREVIIRGVNNAERWTVIVDGNNVTPPTQTDASPGEVILHPEDEVVFEIADNIGTVVKHGILFKSEDEATTFFDFDPDEGEDLEEQELVDGFDWGTGKHGQGTTLAVAEVKELEDVPNGGHDDTARPFGNMNMPQAMVVPSCSGGNFLIAPSTKNPNRILSLKLFDASSASDVVTIEGLNGPNRWEDDEEEVAVGKEIKWVIGSGLHGVRIKNWNEIKDSVEIIEVFGSASSFEANGENSTSTSVSGTVLLHLRINDMPEDDEIDYNCIVHGNNMSGLVEVVESDVAEDGAKTTISGLSNPNRWEEDEEEVQVGDELEWIVGSGDHGVRIKNWNEIKDSVQILEVFGDKTSFEDEGENSESTDVANTVLLRLRLVEIVEDDEIDYNCIVHGNNMSGVVEVSESVEKNGSPKVTIEGLRIPNRWVEDEEEVKVGDELEWKIGSGEHGVNIKNWNSVKGSVEILEVFGDKKSFEMNGKNSKSTSDSGTVLLRLKIVSVPADDLINYNCTVHLDNMKGAVEVSESENE